MRQLDQDKVRHLSKFSQLILLDEKAYIVSSCNSIFPTGDLQNIAVTSWFPFLESIFDYLFQLTPQSSEVKFSKIETPIRQLPGIYDFTFSKISLDNRDLLLWAIYDYTDLYEDFKHYQQRKNEFEILRETLERRHKNLASIEDINTEQNIILENFNHFQLNYFNKLKSALQSPVNALDGFTYVLSSTFQKGGIGYLEALKRSILEVQNTIEELENLSKKEIVAKRFDPQKSNFKLPELLNKIVYEIREQFQSPLRIDLNVDREVPQTLMGDESLLMKTLFGLITNIFRFHPASKLGIVAQVLQQKAEKVQIRFQLTEYLSRDDVALKQEDINNLVLSLSVVKQLIDLQKGKISVEKDAKTLGFIVTCDLEFATIQ